MTDLLLTVIPLAIASAMSPVIFAIAIALSARKATNSLLAFLFGSLLAAAVFNLLGFGLASDQSTIANAIAQPSSSIDLAIGILLAAFGIKTIFAKENDKPKTVKPRSALRWIVIGILVNITNFDAAFLNITAVKTIGQSTAALFEKTTSLLIADFFLLSPVLVPLIILIAAPEKNEKMLSPVRVWMEKYGRFIAGLVFLAFGVIFVMKALG